MLLQKKWVVAGVLALETLWEFPAHADEPLHPPVVAVSAIPVPPRPEGHFSEKEMSLYWVLFNMAPSEVSPGLNAFFARELQRVNPQDGKYTIKARPGALLAGFDTVYFYDWKRDGGFSIEEIVWEYSSTQEPLQKAFLFQKILDRLNFLEFRTSQDFPMGRAKSEMDGTNFRDHWGDPQNDGPAAEANALLLFASVLSAEHSSPELVARIHTLIRKNLKWLSTEWGKSGFDFWEEKRSFDHFATQMVQRRAFIEAANMFKEGSPEFEAALSEVPKLEEKLLSFWNPVKKILTPHKGAEKPEGIDSQVIVGLLRGKTQRGFANKDFLGDRWFTHDFVLSTIAQQEIGFERAYPINDPAKRTSRAIGIGRYLKDFYNGGHIWALSTEAFGEIYQNVAHELERLGELKITELNQAFLARLQDEPLLAQLPVGKVLKASEDKALFAKLVASISSKGDEYHEWVISRRDPNGSLPEQFHGTTGESASIRGLTWSCSAVLSFLRAKNKESFGAEILFSAR